LKKSIDEKICTNEDIVKVSSTFSKVAGVKGRGTPAGKSFILLYGLSVCGSVPIIDWVRRGKFTGQRPLVALRRGRNLLFYQKNGAGVRNATAFRGGEQDRLPFFGGCAKLSSKTFRWNVFDKEIFVWVCAYISCHFYFH
ncbi:MAG: hypothetical protein J6K92_05560, partial [Oscillospiraceae bacterium]|nr:hypothetical protein [Oscillospiraceae bacterium]